MDSIAQVVKISAPEIRRPFSAIQVLQVSDTLLSEDQEGSPTAGIYVCYAPLMRAIDQVWTHNKQIDAVIMGPEYSLSDIISMREVASQKVVPFILHTTKFDWKAQEIAREAGVDEYFTGPFDYSFIRRIELIMRIKSFRNAQGKQPRLRQQQGGSPSVKLWSLKRAFDIVVAVLLVLALSPLVLVILIISTLELSGPVWRSSKRVGKGYKIFNHYKFSCGGSGEDGEAETGMTSFGRFLRSTHLDGIPQLINVILGDMSFVGNSPIPVEEAEKLTKDEIAWRFLAPAGIIGLWRFDRMLENNMASRDCIKLDMEYAMTNSPWLDIKILLYALYVTAAYAKSKLLVQQYSPAEMLTSSWFTQKGKKSIAHAGH
jgi:lipopolysaccharide/colanic/teichoic acid biosynthesis glycosyltransferase